MNNTYHIDRVWSDKFIPEIKRIVGPRLLSPASLEQDAREATDFLVFKARDMRIGARVRHTRERYFERYPFDFTLRSRRDSGAETELSKIIRGWGDWLFYGHGGGADFKIIRWMIVDLNVFREALIKKLRIKFGKYPNGDGTYFVAYDVRSFSGTSSPILIASSFSDELDSPKRLGLEN